MTEPETTYTAGEHLARADAFEEAACLVVQYGAEIGTKRDIKLRLRVMARDEQQAAAKLNADAAALRLALSALVETVGDYGCTICYDPQGKVNEAIKAAREVLAS